MNKEQENNNLTVVNEKEESCECGGCGCGGNN